MSFHSFIPFIRIVTFLIIYSFSQLLVCSNQNDLNVPELNIEMNWSDLSITYHKKYTPEGFVFYYDELLEPTFEDMEQLPRLLSQRLEQLYINDHLTLLELMKKNELFTTAYNIFMESIQSSQNISNLLLNTKQVISFRGEGSLLASLPANWRNELYVGSREEEVSLESNAYEPLQGSSSNDILKDKTGIIILIPENVLLKKALLPKVVSSTGKLIYGSEFLERNIGIQRGILSYVLSRFHTEVKLRTGNNPLVISAISTTGQYSTDIVISNSSAREILQSTNILNQLKKARVIIVYN